ncbi:MAG: hypothetical protein A2036_00245 [Omnitrophica bacterium GWA2_50_21]|nr:MAG: hypothetical protein A2036_00245 [Omnitrophica bacterium GWA2_50_21]
MPRKKILIVDDEPDLVHMISNRLKASGYEVLSALDGQAGLELAKTTRPDLIILDLMLPRMDGYKVCSYIKKDSRYSKIPILLFSAKAQEEDIKMGEEAGADAYIVKPFEAQALLDKIKTLLAE